MGVVNQPFADLRHRLIAFEARRQAQEARLVILGGLLQGRTAPHGTFLELVWLYRVAHAQDGGGMPEA